ncbi:putative repeat protein (TIGR01451 family) [Motilibacter peucedani]|uniref:Putative repeat protein (TIGR01451 family) n=1 Tax=Motilibacter peucedani TaxID=598650 RepID=A0A420XSW3_9ACTN|nr:matrixin family metalloprotease [Motilibacter peucedani]RKS79904.1 putative repeat protein (TIGR01451 family) [Motilibacter peucedani]
MHRPRHLAVLLALLGALALTLPTAASADGPGPALVVAVSGPSTTTVGDTSTFTVTVTNATGLDAGQLELTVSSALPLLSLTSPGAACDAAAARCDTASLPAGAVLSAQVTVHQDLSGTYDLTAGAYGVATTGEDLGTGSASLAFTVAAAPTSLTLTVGPASPVAGSTVTLTARLTTAAGQPVVGEPVTFSRRTGGASEQVGVGTTGSDGVATVTDVAVDTTTYDATYAGSLALGASSAAAAVTVRLGVAVRVSPATVPPGAPLDVVVTVTPAAPAARVAVQQRIGRGGWRTVARPVLDAHGTATVHLRVGGGTGRWSYRVVVPGDGVRSAGSGSAATTVTVRGRGSARAWAPEAGTRSAPVRWNPCAPISYTVNDRLGPPGARADLTEALRRVTMASGLRFRFAGRTSALPQGFLGNTRPGTLLVAWTTPARSSYLPDGVAGFGGYVSSGRRITSGTVTIDARWAKHAPTGFGAGDTDGGVLMHEIGHAVGLGHVSDRWSVMQPVVDLPSAVWGAGDLAGLRAVGRAHGCLSG